MIETEIQTQIALLKQSNDESIRRLMVAEDRIRDLEIANTKLSERLTLSNVAQAIITGVASLVAAVAGGKLTP